MSECRAHALLVAMQSHIVYFTCFICSRSSYHPILRIPRDYPIYATFGSDPNGSKKASNSPIVWCNCLLIHFYFYVMSYHTHLLCVNESSIYCMLIKVPPASLSIHMLFRWAQEIGRVIDRSNP